MTPWQRAFLIAATAAFAQPASAQTLSASFSAAYSKNPQLNVARSQLRETDEGIAIARSGNRPTLFANLRQSFETTRNLAARNGGTRAAPTTVSVALTQPLFRGFQTRNNIRAAEAAVRAQREALSNTEQNILLSTAESFFDVIANGQIVGLRRNDVSFLGEQVRAARDRFEVGEGTRTDISQAEARQASAQSLLNVAVADLATAGAIYREFTGMKAKSLRNDVRDARFIPPSLAAALDIGQNHHPAILAGLHTIDQNIFSVASTEGQLLPTLELTGEAASTFNAGNGVQQSDSASVRLDLSVPIYQGGRVSAQVRQAKEALGTARIQVDVTRDEVRRFTVASWARYQSAVRSIQAARTGVFAAQLALRGVIEEQRVGQRTTLDVLDAQSELISSQVTLVAAERDRSVAAYTLLSAIGRLSAERLGLHVALYEPKEHADAVRDKWFGLRTPDGR
ncbi:MAG: TolC family outer membrane protein [Pseudomonadota bacterium]